MSIFRKSSIFILAFAILFAAFSCKTNVDGDNNNTPVDNSTTVSANDDSSAQTGDNTNMPSDDDNTVTVSDITLTFNSNGGVWSDGTTAKTISGKPNSAFTAPDTPIKTGYTFTGWNPALSEKIPQENTAYTATWTLAGNFIITYELNGGTNSAENPTGYNIETPSTTIKAPAKPGYTFAGWFENENCTGNATTEISGQDRTGNIVLYAKWNANAYTVIFHANNGTNETKSQTFTYDVEQALSENSFSKTGYAFAGWATAENGNAAYADNATVSNLATENTVDLYAVWAKGTSTKYKVEHYQQNTEGNGYRLASTDNLTGITDSATLAVAKNYTGFDAQNFKQSTIAADGSTVIKIYYNRKTVTLTFKDGDTILQTIQGRYGAAVSGTPSEPTKTGFVFKQWNITVPTIFESDKTILAEWTEITITLSETNLVLVYGKTATLTAKIMPESLSDKKVTWTCSIDNVPIIDSEGNITAKRTTVSGSSKNDPIIITAEYNGITATCSLTVLPKILTKAIFVKVVPDYKTITEYELPDGITELQNTNQNDYTAYGVFADCEELTKLTLPDSLTNIGGATFYNCKKLIKIKIPSGVTSIGRYAFQGSGVKEVTIPEGVTELRATFYESGSLEKVNLPDTITSIKYKSFYGCSKLSEITLPKNLKEIGECAFEYCSSLSNITIPETVTSIGGGAFSKCGLKKINIPSEITSLEPYSTYTATQAGMFYNCKKLEEVEFAPNSKLESIPAYTFSGCSSLSKIEIPKGVTVIEDGVFKDCGFTKFEIPDRVTSIGKGAFVGCTNLEEVKTPFVGSTAEDTSAMFGDYFSTTVKKLTVTKNIPNDSWDSNYNYSFETVVIGDDVKSIGYRAFYNCKNLKNVTIGSGVTLIGDSAFYGTGLTSITIPASVKIIGDSAFQETNLTSVTIPASVILIGEYAFHQENLKSLSSVTFEEKSGWKCTYQTYSIGTGWSKDKYTTSIDVTTSYINAKKLRGDSDITDYSERWYYFGIYRE